MSHTHLATYLQDHRSGAVAALELLEHLETAHAGTPIAGFAAGIKTQVQSDVDALDGLMERAGIDHSRLRKAAAWVSEKAAYLKMRIDDPRDGTLRLLETLEAVSLGIEGKLALWNALAAAAPRVPALAGVDFGALAERARQQRQAVEAERLAAARAALQSS